MHEFRFRVDLISFFLFASYSIFFNKNVNFPSLVYIWMKNRITTQFPAKQIEMIIFLLILFIDFVTKFSFLLYIEMWKQTIGRCFYLQIVDCKLFFVKFSKQLLQIILCFLKHSRVSIEMFVEFENGCVVITIAEDFHYCGNWIGKIEFFVGAIKLGPLMRNIFAQGVQN